MSDSKKFFELAANDAAVKSEVEKATLEALKELLTAKGLQAEAQKAVEGAVVKVASAHGMDIAMDEVSEDELKAVAGGSWCLWIMEAVCNAGFPSIY